MNTICGNDGKTYNNPCLLEAAAKCKHGLVMAYQGSCKSVEAIEKANAIPAVPGELNQDSTI